MPKTLSFDGLISSLRAPPVADPFVELLNKYTEKTGAVIITSRLGARRHRRLEILLKKWDKGLPVEGMIWTEFVLPDDPDVSA